MHVSSSLNRLKSHIILFIVFLTVLTVVSSLFYNNSKVSIYMQALLPIINFLCASALLYTAWCSYKNRKDVFKSWLLIGLAMLLYSIANLFYFILKTLWG